MIQAKEGMTEDKTLKKQKMMDKVKELVLNKEISLSPRIVKEGSL